MFAGPDQTLEVFTNNQSVLGVDQPRSTSQDAAIIDTESKPAVKFSSSRQLVFEEDAIWCLRLPSLTTGPAVKRARAIRAAT
jgi:hypothetical protein